MDRLTFAGTYYRVGKVRWSQNGQSDAYSRFDWRVAYHFNLAAAKAELAWTVRNDGNDHAEWFSSAVDASKLSEFIGTRQFASLRVEY